VPGGDAAGVALDAVALDPGDADAPLLEVAAGDAALQAVSASSIAAPTSPAVERWEALAGRLTR